MGRHWTIPSIQPLLLLKGEMTRNDASRERAVHQRASLSAFSDVAEDRSGRVTQTTQAQTFALITTIPSILQPA